MRKRLSKNLLFAIILVTIPMSVFAKSITSDQGDQSGIYITTILLLVGALGWFIRENYGIMKDHIKKQTEVNQDVAVKLTRIEANQADAKENCLDRHNIR